MCAWRRSSRCRSPSAAAPCLCAAGLGLAGGAWLAVARFPGQRAVVAALNTLLGLPSVVVGLVVYLLLSRSGPLGCWGILFTPKAMVIAQTHPRAAGRRRALAPGRRRRLARRRRPAALDGRRRRWPARASHAAARALGGGDGAAHRLRPRHLRGRRGDDRRRQHRRRDPRHDHRDRARDEQGRPAARARARPDPAGRGRR